MANPSAGIRVAVDAVVFTVLDDQLKILLIKRKFEPFKESYALPGGFVHVQESLIDAVKRELQEETGVEHAGLYQVATYGDVKRDPRGRIISTAFLALIAPTSELKAQTDALDARWFSIDTLPQLAFDHATIIADALKHLRFEIQTSNIACQVLPKEFTLTQLQLLYESVLQKALDKRNFRKRMKEIDLLEETDHVWQEGAHRPARLYRFKQRSYAPMHEKVNVFLA
jgi:8-oxo-dGTP diphosphatase